MFPRIYSVQTNFYFSHLVTEGGGAHESSLSVGVGGWSISLLNNRKCFALTNRCTRDVMDNALVQKAESHGSA